MIDPRFFETVGSPTATELAVVTGASIARGDPGVTIRSIAPFGRAQAGDLTFLDGAGSAGGAADGCVLFAPEKLLGAAPAGATVLVCPHPRAAFARASRLLLVDRELEAGQPAVHPSARVADDAVIEPGCVLGPGVAIGSRTRVGANSVIRPGVQIGAGCYIGANVSIRNALIGDGVTILSGAVIGEAGFGLAPSSDGAIRLPHFGRVIIQNNTSLGCNSCVDRGVFDDTLVGEASHIDNLCHLAHNVSVGRHVVMAAFAGVSGTVKIGDGAQFGGRVGIADHVTIGAGSRLAAGSAVMREVPAGETHGGYPAKPMRTWMRELAWVTNAAQKRSGG